MSPTADLAMLFPTRESVPKDVWRTPDDIGLTLLIDGRIRIERSPCAHCS